MEKTECIIERSPTKPNTAKNARAHMLGFKLVFIHLWWKLCCYLWWELCWQAVFKM